MRLHTTSLACLALLCGCQPDPAPVADVHDGKFRRLRPAEGATGRCTLDVVTGLTWELKSDEPGLHDWRNTYSWFDPDEANDELDYRGTPDGGDCVASDCDTTGFVRAVNEAGYCGYNDWRVPSRDELHSISDLRRARSPPTTDREYFPYTQADEYWSSNDYSFQFDTAWAWNFRYGHDRVDWKKSAKFVRLVRGDAADLVPVR